MSLASLKVSIRPWQRLDDEVCERWPRYNDPLEALWNLPRPIVTLPEHWYNSLDSGAKRYSWAVEDETGRLIGRISIRDIDEHKRHSRLGITLGAPYVSQGLGTAALTIFLDHYFTDLGYQAIVLDVAAPNQRAVRCYEHLGFRYVESDDWRLAGPLFDERILAAPQFDALRPFFRKSWKGLEVRFFEMELDREEWLAGRR